MSNKRSPFFFFELVFDEEVVDKFITSVVCLSLFLVQREDGQCFMLIF